MRRWNNRRYNGFPIRAALIQGFIFDGLCSYFLPSNFACFLFMCYIGTVYFIASKIDKLLRRLPIPFLATIEIVFHIVMFWIICWMETVLIFAHEHGIL